MCPLLRFKLVADEIEWCKEYLKQNQCWRIMDISDRAIEEVAATTPGKSPSNPLDLRLTPSHEVYFLKP